MDISKMKVAEIIDKFGIDEKEAKAARQLARNLGNQRWRLNHLYKIVSATYANGKIAGEAPETVIPFRLNFAQKLLYLGLWFCNIILKSRQHGVTTFFCLLYFDICLFNSNTHACIIAHNREDAEDFFEKKILFAYNELPEYIRNTIRSERASSKKLVFSNGSSIRVTTSGRSGTYHLVHISEFGKMCAKYPLKAKEVISGTLNAIHPGMIVSIESTAEGRAGRFYEMCQAAMRMKAQVESGNAEYSKMDYKFFFFGWMDNPFNELDPAGVQIMPRLQAYFEEIEQRLHIKLNSKKRAWYAKKEAVQGDLMKQEHPSTPDEAFEHSTEGAYYARQMMDARKAGRITKVPINSHIPIDTWWDLGYDDANSIWFTQNIGREIHVLHYYEHSGEGLLHYAEYCQHFREKHKIRYNAWWAPWDIIQHEYISGKTRLETAKEMGIVFQVGSKVSIQDQIQLVRNILPICVFDAAGCEEGIAALDSYRKEWNEKTGTFKTTPLHDWSSHGASAFATMAVNNCLMSLSSPGPPITEADREHEKACADKRAWT